MESYGAAEIQSLVRADQEHYLHPTSSIKVLQEKGPKIIVRGKGCTVWDAQGKEYIDGTAGLWLNAVGHGRSDLARVAKEQIETLEYYHSFNEFSNVPAIRLAEKVASMVPVDGAKVFFASSGSEGNDTIFKMVRYYWYTQGRDTKDFIISRERSYHGVSCGAVRATKLPKFHEGFDPLLPAFDYLDVPYCYLCPWGKEYPGCSLECADALEDKIQELGAENVAAFVAEPVAGTGGVMVPPAGYYERIREICDRNDVLFVADEVINAFGRTGAMFGIHHWPGVRPDLMNMAKGITSGYVPLSAVAASGTIFEALASREKFFHGFTYSGHPVACAVGLANIDIIERENLTENARVMGARLMGGLQGLALDGVGEVRGKGLVVGVDLVEDRSTRKKFDQLLGARVVEIAHGKGLITRCLAGDVLQLSPPMVITAEEVDRVVQVLGESIEQAYREFAGAA